MTFTKALLVALLMATAILASTGQVEAQTAPATSVDHAACYRSIIDAEDLFCLTRYELPESISDGVSDAWCAELVNQDGCDGTPADPTEPTSLPVNTAFITLYDGCADGDCSGATLLNVSRVPRIGFAMGGSYVNAGHTITWGDADTHLCVESSDDPADFATPSIDCLPVFWNTQENTTETQRDVLGQDMVDQIRAIGILDAQPTNAYVQNNLINASGKVFALEALENADRILDVFSEGSSPIVLPGFTPSAGSTVQANIDSNTANVQTAKSDFGNNVLGISGDATGVIISLVIVGALMVGIFAIGGNLLFAVVSAVSAASFLVVFGLLPFQIMAVIIVLLALPASVKVVRMVTQ